MKIALVSIDPIVLGCARPTRSLGTYQLSTYARTDPGIRSACAIEIHDWVLPNFGGRSGPCAETRRLASILADGAFDLVGFSTKIWNFHHVRNLARLVKAARPSTAVLAGGYQVMGRRFPSLMLAEGEPFDFLITGEGEVPFARLLRALLAGTPLDACPALWRRRPGGTAALTGPAVKTDLAGMPSTFDEVGDGEDFSGRLVILEASRGCPYACHFCEWAVTPLQIVPLERVFWEIDHVMSRGGNKIFFADGTFNLDRTRRFHPIVQHLIDRLEHYTERFGPRFKREARIGLELRPELISERCAELLEELARRSDETFYEFGLQTTGEEAGRLSARPYDEGKWASAMGRLGPVSRSRAAIDVIPDLPGNTLAAIADSHRVAIRIGAGVGNWRLLVLPGTELESAAEELGIAFDPWPPHHASRWLDRSPAEVRKLVAFGFLCDLMTRVFFDLWRLLENTPPGDLHFASVMLGFDRWLEKRGLASRVHEPLAVLSTIYDREASGEYAAHRDAVLRQLPEHFAEFAGGEDFYGTAAVPPETRQAVSAYLVSHSWFAAQASVSA